MSNHSEAIREGLKANMVFAEVSSVIDLTQKGILFVEDGNHGENRPRQNEFAVSGIPFLRPPDLKNGRVDFENCGFINESGFARVRKGIGKPGDIILTHRATVGRMAITGSDAPPVFVTNPGTTIWRSLDPKVLNQRFLYFYMNSRLFLDRLMSEVGHTSTFDYVSLTQQRGLPVLLPPIERQEDIAYILGSLDDKIELNRKSNETLEGIAKSLFHSWFVNFDPVRAKAEGRPTGLPDEVGELFPDSFEESELGKIPSGWSVTEISEFLDLERDSVTPSDSEEEIFDHYSIPAYDDGLVPSLEAGKSIKSNKYLVTDGVFMVSKLNPRFPRIWVPSRQTKRRRICSTEFLVCRPKATMSVPFVLHVAKSRSVVQPMSDLASGTSNSHQRVRPADFVGLPFVKPSAALVKLFSEIVEPILEKHLLTRNENQALSKCCDALLPRLVSGDLRIPDAEKMLEEIGI